jgi:predicted flap endonuclease-1-like 5' DNA nuclease
VSTRRLPPEAFSTDLPAIGRPANAALVAHGITTLEQVATMTSNELLALHGVGPRAVRILGEALAARNLAFADA